SFQAGKSWAIEEWDAQIFGSPIFFEFNTRAKAMAEKKRVLILCAGNSARSQMAEGILRRLSKEGGDDVLEVFSAGVKASFVRQEAIQVMSEIGIDISNYRSKSIDEFIGQRFDYVITVCDNAKESCPVFPGDAVRIHQNFEDPPAPGVGEDEFRLAAFRRVRDEIRQWMKGFIKSL